MAVRRKKTGKTMSKTARMARERAIIHDLHNGGMTYRQIANKHKVSLPTVNAKARKAGISRRPRAGAKAKIAQAPVLAARMRGRKRGYRTATRGTIKTAAVGRQTHNFSEQFRCLIMQYYPNMPLARFEQLSVMIRRAIV